MTPEININTRTTADLIKYCSSTTGKYGSIKIETQDDDAGVVHIHSSSVLMVNAIQTKELIAALSDELDSVQIPAQNPEGTNVTTFSKGKDFRTFMDVYRACSEHIEGMNDTRSLSVTINESANGAKAELQHGNNVRMVLSGAYAAEIGQALTRKFDIESSETNGSCLTMVFVPNKARENLASACKAIVADKGYLDIFHQPTGPSPRTEISANPLNPKKMDRYEGQLLIERLQREFNSSLTQYSPDHMWVEQTYTFRAKEEQPTIEAPT